MNETTCVTVAKSNLQTEARMDQSTSGQQSAYPRHFTDTLECIFFFFLLRRFAVCKIIQICCVLHVGSGHSTECSRPLSHSHCSPLTVSSGEVSGQDHPDGEMAWATLSKCLVHPPGDASPQPSRKTRVDFPCVSPVHQLIISEPKM